MSRVSIPKLVYRHLVRWTAIDPRAIVNNLRGIGPFLRNYRRFKRLANKPESRISGLFPMLRDRYDSAGTACGGYFNQDLFVARQIYRARPDAHFDIGSRVDGFISHLLVFRDVTVIDVRPLDSHVSGLTFMQGNATSLDNIADESIRSLSCLHAFEHFGLGRYGDDVDPDAIYKAKDEITRIVAPGGTLYFSVPVTSENQLWFDAHRVFSPEFILSLFSDFELETLNVVGDDGHLVTNADVEFAHQQRFGLGIFIFTRRASV